MSKPFNATDLRRHIAHLLAVTASSWRVASAHLTQPRLG
jgi:hypothetical protein